MTEQNSPAGRCSPMPDRTGHARLSHWTNHRRKGIAARFGENRRGSACAGAGGDICHGVFRPDREFRKGAERYFAGVGAGSGSQKRQRRTFMRASRRGRRLTGTGFIVPQSVRRFWRRYVWHYPYPLDEQAMVRAAGLVEGEHDFTSFAAVDPERGTPKAARRSRI